MSDATPYTAPRCDHATVICGRCERALEWCACTPKCRGRVLVARQQCVPCNDETLPEDHDD